MKNQTAYSKLSKMGNTAVKVLRESATIIPEQPLEAPNTRDLEKVSQHQTSPIEYSTFTKNQKRLISFLVAFASMFSPLSSFIYYPAITSMASSLHVSVELINLTISTYMIVSGIAPAIVGSLSDTVGRRPIYLVTIMVYLGANIGLAVQDSYVALLLLRMMQSLGSSGMLLCSGNRACLLM